MMPPQMPKPRRNWQQEQDFETRYCFERWPQKKLETQQSSIPMLQKIQLRIDCSGQTRQSLVHCWLELNLEQEYLLKGWMSLAQVLLLRSSVEVPQW